jgi:hypothetical protein
MINVIQGDVFTASADALVVPIDGTFVPRDGQYERLLGNIGRQFIKRFPSADFVDEMEGQLDLPLALGDAAPIEVSEGPFRVVVVVSTLFHISHLDDRYKRSVIRESFLQALRVAQQAETKDLATAILQGGWRFTPEIAFSEMLQAYASASAQLPDVYVYCLESSLADRLRDVAHSLGFR